MMKISQKIEQQEQIIGLQFHKIKEEELDFWKSQLISHLNLLFLIVSHQFRKALKKNKNQVINVALKENGISLYVLLDKSLMMNDYLQELIENAHQIVQLVQWKILFLIVMREECFQEMLLGIQQIRSSFREEFFGQDLFLLQRS